MRAFLQFLFSFSLINRSSNQLVYCLIYRFSWVYYGLVLRFFFIIIFYYFWKTCLDRFFKFTFYSSFIKLF
jgi:hypothetical protein